MSDQSYSMSLTVDRDPATVWAAVCDVRGWWSQEIEGPTDRAGAGFRYHYRDVHRCAFQITEFVPLQRMVWHVVENEFNFTKDRTEWVGTDVIFELHPSGAGTEVRFTHRGLVPAYECFEICRDAWSGYLGGSLRDLILTGKGQPNPLEGVVERARQKAGEDFRVTVRLEASPGTVMAAVDRPADWWSRDIAGSVDRIGDQFEFRYKDVHWSLQRVVEKVPGRLAVWEVTDSRLSFTKDPAEWTGTRLAFEAIPSDGGTELIFTHQGLVPSKECYSDCVEGWTYFIRDSLASLVLTGVGKPETSETAN